jgi:hypothetical protein
MFDDKKENRRKNLHNSKRKDSFKKNHRYEDEDDFVPKKRGSKNSLRDTRAEELWEEWQNRSNSED